MNKRLKKIVLGVVIAGVALTAMVGVVRIHSGFAHRYTQVASKNKKKNDKKVVKNDDKKVAKPVKPVYSEEVTYKVTGDDGVIHTLTEKEYQATLDQLLRCPAQIDLILSEVTNPESLNQCSDDIHVLGAQIESTMIPDHKSDVFHLKSKILDVLNSVSEVVDYGIACSDGTYQYDKQRMIQLVNTAKREKRELEYKVKVHDYKNK